MRKNGVVYVYNQSFDDAEILYKQIKIHSPDLRELKNRWGRLVLEEPEEIRLMYKDGKFEFLGRLFPGENDHNM